MIWDESIYVYAYFSNLFFGYVKTTGDPFLAGYITGASGLPSFGSSSSTRTLQRPAGKLVLKAARSFNQICLGNPNNKKVCVLPIVLWYNSNQKRKHEYFDDSRFIKKNQKKQPKRWCQFFCLWHLVFLGKDLSYSEGTVGLELEAEPIEPWKLRQPMVSDSFDREVGSHGWWTQKASKKETRGWYIYIYIYKNHGFRFDYVCVYWNLMWLVDSCWCASWSLISYEVLGQESSQDSAFKMQRLLESWGQDYCSNLDGSVWRWSVVSW